ncbi:MAG: hypothetical protein ACE5G0_18385, partial [Rhodothermales bacterium]
MTLPLGIGFDVVFGGSALIRLLVVLVAAGIGIAGGIVWLRRKSIDAELIAVHLDRTNPTLEESTALLLHAPDTLRLIERIQQRRVFEAFHRLQQPLAVPGKGLLIAGGLLGLSIVFSGAMALWAPRPLANRTGSHGTPVRLQPVSTDSLTDPVQVETARVTVTPPPYTGQPSSTSDDLHLDVLQHATATWEVTLDQPIVQGRLLFSDGDTLTMQSDDSRTYRAQRALRYSGFYLLEFVPREGALVRSDYYPITVTEDIPPVLTVVHPESRTVIEPGTPPRVAVKVLADDDYGLDSVRLVATVSKGSGENVKFREQALA